jgi:hypothetical protein
VHLAVEGELAKQAIPHPPQLLLSACSLTHALLHQDSPDEQMHWPVWQVAPVQAMHAVPLVPHIESVWLA